MYRGFINPISMIGGHTRYVYTCLYFLHSQLRIGWGASSNLMTRNISWQPFSVLHWSHRSSIWSPQSSILSKRSKTMHNVLARILDHVTLPCVQLQIFTLPLTPGLVHACSWLLVPLSSFRVLSVQRVQCSNLQVGIVTVGSVWPPASHRQRLG